MDVIQCKILANRCEPEFLHGLGWLGLEQGQTEDLDSSCFCRLGTERSPEPSTV